MERDRCTVWLQLASLAVVVQLARPAHAQRSDWTGLQDPGGPQFSAEEVRSERSVLPPLSLPEPEGRTGASSEIRRPTGRISGIRIRGNTVLPQALLEEVSAPYANSEIDFEELLKLQDQLTLLYVERGYVTSGAVLSPELDADGFAEFQIVEGKLREVRVSGAQHYRTAYLKSRVMPSAQPIANVGAIEQRLKLLQADPRIERVEARLVPGPTRGLADLDLVVHEGSPLRMSFELDNHQSPAVGGRGGRIELAHLNLTGRGDVLRGSYGKARGLDQYSFEYETPLGSYGTTLGVRYQGSRGRILETPFEELDFRNRTATYRIDLQQALLETETTSLNLGASAEYRRSTTTVFGDSGFSSSPGRDDGVDRMTIAEFSQELTHRGARHVLAARSTFRVRLRACGNSSSLPGVGASDHHFLSWLGQAQWVQRWSAAMLLVRGDLQVSNDPLPGIEQFGLGGHATVRGYRENRLVHDNGWVGSLELRLPVWRRANGEPFFQIAPFFDVGGGWDTESDLGDPPVLSSAGIGLLIPLRHHLYAELYYAHAFRSLGDASRTRDLQDRGVHFVIGSVFP